jgi:hypothetical protein
MNDVREVNVADGVSWQRPCAIFRILLYPVVEIFFSESGHSMNAK